MGSLVLNGATSGATTIQPTDAVTVTCTLPSTGGTLQTSGAGFTTNGVAYATSTSALATGSALQFDGANLGLGAAPAASLYAGSNINIGSSSYLQGTSNTYGLIIANNILLNGSTSWKYINSAPGTQYSQQAGVHYWYNTPTGTVGNTATLIQAMTLDNSGNLLVGSTSVIANANNFVYSPGNAWGIFGHVNGTASGIDFTKFYYNGAQIGSISQSGTTAVLYNTSSDQRLKTNIVDAPDGNIDQIKIRSFDWKADGTHNTYGVIAQELLEVAPYAVHVPANPDEMMGVDYSKLVPMMIKAIQELNTLVTTQSAEIAALKAKVGA